MTGSIEEFVGIFKLHCDLVEKTEATPLESAYTAAAYLKRMMELLCSPEIRMEMLQWERVAYGAAEKLSEGITLKDEKP